MTDKSDELSDRTNAINQSGAFLQNYVSNQLNKRGWYVDSEIPVQIAPFVSDPLTHRIHLPLNDGYEKEKLVESFYLSQNQSELEETVIDNVGTVGENTEFSFNLCIECKKLDPNYADWVFFDVKRKTSMNLITKTITSQGFVTMLKVPPYRGRGNEIFIQLNKLNWDPFKRQISESSLGVSNKKLSKEIFQTKKSLIDNASRQIIKGTFGKILTDVQHQILSGDGYSHSINVYVPIIVTTANLLICENNIEDIDSETGLTTKEPTYTKTDSIIYRCPNPKSVRFPHTDYTALDMDTRKAVSKWDVMIFTPKGFADFLDYLRDVDLVLTPRML